MAAFTNQEYADMLMAYGKADGNGREAKRIYEERFPTRRQPNRHTFETTFRRLRETGNLNRREPGVTRQRNVADDERVLEAFNEDPTASIRTVAATLNLSAWKVWSVLHVNGMHPFHFTPVQGLEENDYQRRVQFCRLLLHMDVDNCDFLKSILWTDESKFTREGIVNFHNLHHWAPKGQNPRKKRAVTFQRKFSVNVWAGLIGNTIVGPHYLPDNLNGDNYLNFLINDLPELMGGVPNIENEEPVVFQQDGCPAHWTLTVREHLDNSFPNAWIGRNGPIPWPARSPDLTPLDFYIWGRAKALVYTEIIDTREQLIEKIDNAFVKMKQEIRLNQTTTEIRKRCYACIRNNGHQFEQDLE